MFCSGHVIGQTPAIFLVLSAYVAAPGQGKNTGFAYWNIQRKKSFPYRGKDNKDVKQLNFPPLHLRSHRWRTVLGLIAAMSLIVGAFGVAFLVFAPTTSTKAAGLEPCDIYASYGTPCVAAHSSVRALFANYSGPLYQIQRASDHQYLDISVQTPGGYANADPQAPFCSGTSCTITKIYDQSSQHNDLPISAGGYWKGPGPNGSDNGANAMALPVTVGGHHVYGVKIDTGMGYRIYHTKGVATNGQPEGMYMVAGGTYYNSGCCFDYGNAETDGGDDGNGTMDAVYFGTLCWFGYVVEPNQPCAGRGPWVMADMENGLFAGGNGHNSNNTGINTNFVTAMLKNNGQTTYSIRGGNAQSGSLTTWYSGGLPTRGGYIPMHQQGSIILGTGGDNSNGAQGEFFEGLMTAGYPSDAAENAVQANIVAAGYGSNTPPPTPTPSGSPTPSPTPTTPGSTPTPTQGTGGTCSIHYAVTNQWPGGFGVNVTVNNTSSTTINGWSVKWTFANGQTITQLWNGSVTQSGGNVSVSNVSYNATIAPGGTSSFGFNGSWNGSNTSPTSFALNGQTCSTV